MTEPAVLDITKPIALEVTKRINSMWYADMEIEFNDYIQPECYVEFNNVFYISKIINKSMYKGRKTFKVRLEHGMTELNDFGIGPFTWTGKTCAEMAALALAGTTWSVGTVSGFTGTKTIKSDKRITVLAALNLIVNAFYGELDFHALHLSDGSFQRTVDIKNEIGSQTKVQIRYDKNSDIMERREDTTKLCTRLYIYGKDNLTISSVNGGLAYLDSVNISKYPHPKETTIYTNIDVVATLLTYAQIYLGAYDDPLYTYNINSMDKSIFPTWSSEEIDLGDSLRVYNSDLGINVDVRVKQVIHDLVNPDKIKMELANFIDRITDLLSDLDKAVKENTYENAPNTFIPSPPADYEEPIPISGIYTISSNLTNWAGTLLAERALARDGNGYLHAVWQSGPAANSENVFYGKSVDNGKTWAIQQITAADSDYADFSNSSIAIDSSNNVYIVCAASLGARVNQILLYVSNDNGSTFNSLIEVPFTGSWNSGPSVGVDGNDVLHIVQLRYYSGGKIQHISSSDGGGTWSAVHDILEAYTGNVGILDTGCPAFEISWDANDVLHVGIRFNAVTPAKYHIMYKNSSDGGATWGNAVVLNKSINNNASAAKFAVGVANYSLYYIWEEIEGGVSNIYCNTCTDNVWGTPELISNGIENCYEPTVSVDSLDQIYVSWVSLVGSSDYQIKIRKKSNGSWGLEYTRTVSEIDKRRPHLAHAQNPIINGLHCGVIYDGFAMMYEEDNGTSSDMKFWIDCSEIF